MAISVHIVDAADATVTLDVLAPPPGARGLFLGPDDALLADLDLASGHASYAMPQGGSVHVLVPLNPCRPTGAGSPTRRDRRRRDRK
jgi:hypothetical protein